MYRRFFCAFVAIAALFAPALASSEDAAAQFVRLHVVAAGDTQQEQALKLHVRDACLDLARERLAACADADEAFAQINVALTDFERAAVAAAREWGYRGSVRVETGTFAFPDRLYGDLFVPAGDYRALRVTLGQGQGHNWWCVLYPTLCVLDEQSYMAGEQPPVEFYSSLANFFGKLFGG